MTKTDPEKNGIFGLRISGKNATGRNTSSNMEIVSWSSELPIVPSDSCRNWGVGITNWNDCFVIHRDHQSTLRVAYYKFFCIALLRTLSQDVLGATVNAAQHTLHQICPYAVVKWLHRSYAARTAVSSIQHLEWAHHHWATSLDMR